MKKLLSAFTSLLLCIACAATVTGCSKSESNLAMGKELMTYDSQLDALKNLNEKTVDAAVIDSVMAGYYVNNGSFVGKLVIKDFDLATEQYGIAAKKGNDALISKINDALIALSDTAYADTAEKYGLASEKLITAQTVNDKANATDDSWQKIAERKKVVIGYTVFAPIAYDDDGLTGFDIDLAKAVFKYLDESVVCEFQLIKWEQKEAALENGTIDLVWNGLTITDERLAQMCISLPYLRNKQVVVIRKDDENKYTDKKSLDSAIIGVEKGSAGEDAVKG